jgi:pilus assembly protein Flp/PilA
MLHLYVSLTNAMARLRDEEQGATAVEYGLIVSLIAIFLIAAFNYLGGALDTLFRNAADAL